VIDAVQKGSRPDPGRHLRLAAAYRMTPPRISAMIAASCRRDGSTIQSLRSFAVRAVEHGRFKCREIAHWSRRMVSKGLMVAFFLIPPPVGRVLRRDAKGER